MRSYIVRYVFSVGILDMTVARYSMLLLTCKATSSSWNFCGTKVPSVRTLIDLPSARLFIDALSGKLTFRKNADVHNADS